MNVRANVARNLFPKIKHKPNNCDSKRHQRKDRFLNRLVIDFEFVLASKTTSRRSKTLPKTPKMAQDGPRRLQTFPGALWNSILVHLGLNFQDFMVNFDLLLDGLRSFLLCSNPFQTLILEGFGIDFGKCRVDVQRFWH